MTGMEIVVVFESMYGVTHEIADAIAEGATEGQPGVRAVCLRVGDADPERAAAADLLVVGGPTHMRGMSSGMTRKMAARIERDQETKRGTTMGHGLEPGAEGDGLRDWFHQLPQAPKGRRAAAFDTRGAGPGVGAAAKGIAHRLERHGYSVVAEPEGFVVEGDAGLLKAGERDRARAWGAELARRAVAVGAGG
jgi:Flavodoxin